MDLDAITFNTTRLNHRTDRAESSSVAVLSATALRKHLDPGPATRRTGMPRRTTTIELQKHQRHAQHTTTQRVVIGHSK